MIIPPHHIARGRFGGQSKPPSRQQVVAGAVAGLATAVAAGVTALLQNGGAGDRGDLTVLGILIAVAATIGGFVLARVIGRRGKI